MATVRLLLLVLFFFVLSCAPAVAKKQSGYKLTQYSDYWGPQTCFVTSRGLWLHSPKLELTMFFTDPERKVICFNSKNKTYITCGMREWAERFVGRVGIQPSELKEGAQVMKRHRESLKKGVLPKVGSRVSQSMVTGGVQTRCGRQALQFFISGADDLLFPPLEKPIEVWMMPSLKIKDSLIQGVCEVGGIPHGVGLPIEVYRHLPKGKKLIQYRTSKIEEVMVDDNLFKLPPGYKLAEDEMSLLTDEKSGSRKKGDLSDIFGDLDDLEDASAAGKKPKPSGNKQQGTR